MAIDTRERRASCLGVGVNPLRSYSITFGGGINAPDRLHAVVAYRGIAAAAPGGTVLAALERAFFRFMSHGMFRRMN